jgi:ABC-2 type transport system ATP-binding protein
MGILRIKNLRKRYGNREVLRGIDLTLRKGEMVCVMGKNGSGKTTLLNSVLGIIDFEGEVEIKTERVGFALQEPSLYLDLTGWENLRVFAGFHGRKLDDVMELIDGFGLRSELGKPVKELSHGNAKKLEIVCSLLGDPELILMDEPLVSLDFESRKFMLDLMRELKDEGKVLLVVTHLPEMLCPLCDRTFELVDGMLVERECRKN